MIQLIDTSQSYVLERGQELEYNLEIIEHDVRSDSCEDRAELLGVSVGDVARSLYFGRNGNFIGVVVPGDFPRVSPKNLFPEVLGMSRSQANKYSLRRIPTGMSYGTCTPFAKRELVGKEIEHLLIWNNGTERKVYTALGGEDEESHRVSLQLPSYDAIYQILVHEFGDNIVKRLQCP